MKSIRGKSVQAAESRSTYGEPRVKIAELKAHLSRHLQTVREGGEVVVLDRKTPIARIVPYEAKASQLIVHEPTKPWGSIMIPPRPKKHMDSLTALLKDREENG